MNRNKPAALRRTPASKRRPFRRSRLRLPQIVPMHAACAYEPCSPSALDSFPRCSAPLGRKPRKDTYNCLQKTNPGVPAHPVEPITLRITQPIHTPSHIRV